LGTREGGVMKTKIIFVICGACLSATGKNLFAQSEDDYEFIPPQAWSGKAETGGDDATSALSEGFEGLTAEPTKNVMIEPVDGDGGFDNVAPRLSVEEGPGGLEWDVSPTYRTRYKKGTNYVTSYTFQGNNWFSKIPYLKEISSNDMRVRFDANTFRRYNTSVYNSYPYICLKGNYGNCNSILCKYYSYSIIYYLYDTRGKTYVFDSQGRCTKIIGLGGAEIEIQYSVNAGNGSISVYQKKSLSSIDAVRKFVYTISSYKTTQIQVWDGYDGNSWSNNYRNIKFTYQFTGASECNLNDLIGIQDEKLLSPTGV
jgi:hypothetical protein